MSDTPTSNGPNQRRRRLLKLMGAGGAAALAGCSGTGGTDTPTPTPTSGSDGDGGGGDDTDTEMNGDGDGGGGDMSEEEAFFEEAAANVDADEITLVTESTPPSLFYQDNAVPRFEELTGISVDFQAVAFGEMSNRIVSNATSNQPGIDIAYTEQDSLAAYASNEWLRNLTAYRSDNDELAMPNFNIDDFVAFGQNFRFPIGEGPYFAYPMEAFLKNMIYREDIYENEEMASAYQDEHGEEFTVPSNPDQYMRSAQFITENSEEIMGTQMAGHAAQVSGVTGVYAMVETYFPIHGVYNWGFDLSNFHALASEGGNMNSDAAIEAFQFYRDLLDFAPEGVRSYTWSGPPDAIIAGDAAQAMVYSENLGNMVSGDLAYDPSDLGVALPPVRDGVVEAARNGDGYVGYFDGGGYGVMSASNRPAAAYLFLQWMTRPSMSERLATEVGAITRESAIDAASQELINEATGYVDFFQENQQLFKGNPVGRIQATLVNEIFLNDFQEFVAGNISAEVVANRWAYNTEQRLAELGFVDEAGSQPSPI
jgi:multiple sugar transport system substrate-binding protein